LLGRNLWRERDQREGVVEKNGGKVTLDDRSLLLQLQLPGRVGMLQHLLELSEREGSDHLQPMEKDQP
jgi:hypothetical protein